MSAPLIYDPLTFGAKGDGITLDSKAIQTAIDTAHNNGGGTVWLRAGKIFLSGSLVFKSNVWLHVEQGCLLQCSKNWEDITERWPEGMVTPSDAAQVHTGQFLTAYRGTTNIGITGSGIIDGAGEHYRGEDKGTHFEIMLNRPFLVFFIGVTHLTLRDVTFRESSCWTLRLSGCEDVVIQSIRIRGDLKLPNCDGIDLDRCRRARVSDCDIICADDGISLKATKEFADLGSTEDIVVTNCTITTRSSALVVGVDNVAPTRNVTFANCVIRDSNRGVSVNLGEDSVYENILFSNLVIETRVWGYQWWGRGEPIYVSASPWFEDKIGTIKNVRFTNILCRSECGVYIASESSEWIRDVVLDNVRVEMKPWSGSTISEEQCGNYDRRPASHGPQIYTPAEGIAGFHFENITGLKVKNSEVVWVGAHPSYGNAVWSRGCKGLRLDVEGEAAQLSLPAIDVDEAYFDATKLKAISKRWETIDEVDTDKQM